jgi:hypothetical protein
MTLPDSILTLLLQLAVILIPVILERLQAKSPREKYADDIKQMDRALADRDADRINVLFAGLRIPAVPGPDGRGGIAGGQGG